MSWLRNLQYQRIEKGTEKKEAKADEETVAVEEKQEAYVPLVTHVNNTLLSNCSTFEVYINNQQIYNSTELYAHKPYICNNFAGAICEYNGVLHCEVYDYEEFSDQIIDAHLSEPFSTGRMKVLSRPDGFILYGKLGVDFISRSELLYRKLKLWLRLIRTKHILYMITDNPNYILGLVSCSLYIRRIALKDEYHPKRMDMFVFIPVEFK